MERRQDRRANNIEIFRDTAARCRDEPRLAESVRRSLQREKLIPEGEALPPLPPAKRSAPAEIVLSGRRSFQAAGRYAGRKVCVLNFASSANPGGGVLRGASAQEESLCRCSTLYFTLDTPPMWEGFYRPHREAGDSLHNDDVIYTPGVTVFKSDETVPRLLPEEAWYQVDVLTCAAPNLRRCVRMPDRERLGALLEKRIRRILAISAREENDVLILGAFGCGAFRNPPDLVAQRFRRAVEDFLDRFETIEFAVFHTERETGNYDAFVDAFRDLIPGTP